MTCSHDNSIQIWTTTMQKVIKKLVSLDTCVILTTALRAELHAWRKALPLPNINSLPHLLQKAIKQQRQIGWKQFMEGLISKSWGLYMNNYYKRKYSQRKATTWAARLIKYSWEAIFEIWDGRNKQLHDIEHIKDMEDVPELKPIIEVEWTTGLGRLPTVEFSPYFSIKIEELLQKSINSLKAWLLAVRQRRILMDPENLKDDELANSKAMQQQWIGISYTVTDDEARPILCDSIEEEFKIGLDNLPPTKYNHYFNTTLTTLLELNTIKLKEWFVAVRTGRIHYNSSCILLDDFMHPGALNDWAELEIL